ncbi:MAG: hypothetical protein GKS01_08495 [Alphaproteobacteria bacterium]|nr:hypothetical protein [Alphaproteobacteria bacterium]
MRRIFGYLLVIGLPVLGAAYMAEIYLWYLGSKSMEAVAQKSGHKYDARSKTDVVAALRKAGKKASLYVPPETLFRPQGKDLGSALKGKDGKALLSLGGVSATLNVVCNEGGAFFRYPSDRYGFNNPDKAWDSATADMVTLGDSFTLGNCVPPGKSMVDLLRPKTGTLINLGGGGNGPLFMLAGLREYGARFKPKTVLWFFYNNDIENLRNERRNPILRRYLANDTFSQSLSDRQREIDKALSKLVALFSEKTNWRESTLFRILRLQTLRHRVVPPKPARGQSGGDLIAEYGKVLTKARTMAAGWDGKVVFVYLPYPPRYFAPDALAVKAASARKQQMLALAKKAEVSTIDLEPAFDAYAKPGDLAYAANTHYSEAGYRLAAETIAKALVLKKP